MPETIGHKPVAVLQIGESAECEVDQYFMHTNYQEQAIPIQHSQRKCKNVQSSFGRVKLPFD